MSCRLLERQRGAILECNGCDATLITGQIEKRLIRAYGASIGWIRGLWGGSRKVPSTKKHDYCPSCAPAERAALAAKKQARIDREKARDAKREERKRKDAERAAKGSAA